MTDTHRVTARSRSHGAASCGAEKRKTGAASAATSAGSWTAECFDSAGQAEDDGLDSDSAAGQILVAVGFGRIGVDGMDAEEGRRAVTVGVVWPLPTWKRPILQPRRDQNLRSLRRRRHCRRDSGEENLEQ